MRQLTNDQAAMLRDMRRPLRAAIREVIECRNDLVDACGREEKMSDEILIVASELPKSQADRILARFDRTEPHLQRKILLRFVADRTNLLSAAKIAIETRDLMLLQRAVEIAETQQ